MKRNLMSLVGRTITLAMFTAIAAGACFGQANKGGGRLTGTWDAVVTLRNCATGDELNTFASIGTFNLGGTFIGSTSGLPQASRTPEHGVWRHVSDNTYIFMFKSFNFDAAGNAVSYGVVTHELILDSSSDNYTSAGIAQIFLMNGTQIAQGCSDAIGTRFGF